MPPNPEVLGSNTAWTGVEVPLLCPALPSFWALGLLLVASEGNAPESGVNV